MHKDILHYNRFVENEQGYTKGKIAYQYLLDIKSYNTECYALLCAHW